MKHPFDQYPLQGFLPEALKKLDIVQPTPVQEQAIPAILQGQDIIGQSQTGTGKTLAYLLPVLNRLEPQKHELQALILAPTRELTRQIAETAAQLISGTELDVLLIQGGVDINRQIQRLRRNPHLVVGTPGRVLDLINQNKLLAHTARFLVIDEADTMLEMGFKEDIEKIVRKMKRNIQRMLFSATLPPKVIALAKTFMKQPQQIAINPEERAVSAITNVFFKSAAGDKEEMLLRLLRLYNPYLGIVFTRRKEQVDNLVTRLRQAGINAEGLHGDMQPGQRKQVMRRFREARSQVLVATDIASRGLDVEGITHIFNYDLPVGADQYIHRTGRTGRAGESGVAVNLVTAAEEEKLKQIAQKLNQPFKEKGIENDEIADIKKSPRPGPRKGVVKAPGHKARSSKKEAPEGSRAKKGAVKGKKGNNEALKGKKGKIEAPKGKKGKIEAPKGKKEAPKGRRGLLT